MSAEAFVDTNVLLYAASGALRYPDKHKRAWEIIGPADYAISAQVLAEFFVNARKSKPGQTPLSGSEAASWVERLTTLEVVPVDSAIVQHGVAYALRYQINYWDAALIAAAESISATILYTEDLNHKQKYGSVTAINPFRAN